MWRDEIHSWGLVLASSSLAELFANLHFTGHPGLWYLILWVVSFFTNSPYALQAVHGVIAVALIATIALRSPFARLERLLLLSSYFVVFEYTVVSRAYGLGFLIALIYADMRARRADSFSLNAVLLGLLANTSLFGFLLSGAFAAEYALDALLRRWESRRAELMALLPPAVLYLGLIALAVETMWPSPDISWRTTGVPLSNAFDFENLWATIAGTVETILPTHPLNYWNSLAPGTVSTTSAVALPALALVYFHIFRAHRRLLIIPGLTVVASIAVAQLVYANSMRHWGINFVAFVATLWINKCWERARSFLVVGLLAVNAAAGIAISVQQFPATFSQGQNTAEWIRENGFADDALVGTPDTLTSVVAQYLGKPIYFLDCNCMEILPEVRQASRRLRGKPDTAALAGRASYASGPARALPRHASAEGCRAGGACRGGDRGDGARRLRRGEHRREFPPLPGLRGRRLGNAGRGPPVRTDGAASRPPG